MIKTLNVLALAALIGSATMAYSVKYETILVAEKLKKRESELVREKDAIAILKAEWQLLNRPERLQKLAAPEAGVQALSARQIVRANDIPQAKPEGDKLANALDGLLTGSIPEPKKTSAKSLTPANATLRPVAKAPVTPRPGQSTKVNGTAKANLAPKPASSQSKVVASAPLSLRPPGLVGQPAAATARKDDPIARALAGVKPVPPKPVTPPKAGGTPQR